MSLRKFFSSASSPQASSPVSGTLRALREEFFRRRTRSRQIDWCSEILEIRRVLDGDPVSGEVDPANPIGDLIAEVVVGESVASGLHFGGHGLESEFVGSAGFYGGSPTEVVVEINKGFTLAEQSDARVLSIVSNLSVDKLLPSLGVADVGDSSSWLEGENSSAIDSGIPGIEPTLIMGPDAFDPGLIDRVFEEGPGIPDAASLAGSKDANAAAAAVVAISGHRLSLSIPGAPTPVFPACPDEEEHSASRVSESSFTGSAASVSAPVPFGRIQGAAHRNTFTLVFSANGNRPGFTANTVVGDCFAVSQTETEPGVAPTNLDDFLEFPSDIPEGNSTSQSVAGESVHAFKISFFEFAVISVDHSRVSQPRLVAGSAAPIAGRKIRDDLKHSESAVRAGIPDPEIEHPVVQVFSGSVPAELRYDLNPRGPPVYGRDANVPLVDSNASTDQLERLRYSIAPRGPSLVIVETQSPGVLSSSGPKFCPETYRLILV